MGKRFAVVIGVAVFAAALIAVGASADFRSVHDPRGDTKCSHDHTPTRPCSDRRRRDADIVRATAGHDGTRLRHTIRVVRKLHQAHLLINTDSDPACEWAVFASRGGGEEGVEECASRKVVAPARYDFHRDSVEIFFSETSIGNPQGYGWKFFTGAGSGTAYASDSVPNGGSGDYIRHTLG